MGSRSALATIREWERWCKRELVARANRRDFVNRERMPTSVRRAPRRLARHMTNISRPVAPRTASRKPATLLLDDDAQLLLAGLGRSLSHRPRWLRSLRWLRHPYRLQHLRRTRRLCWTKTSLRRSHPSSTCRTGKLGRSPSPTRRRHATSRDRAARRCHATRRHALAGNPHLARAAHSDADPIGTTA